MPVSEDRKTPLPEERPRGGRLLTPADFMLAVGDEVARAWRYDRMLSVAVGMIDPMARPERADFGGAEIEAAIVELMRAELRVADRIASFGTGEIAMLTPEANIRQAHVAMTRICLAVEGELFDLRGVQFRASVSIGVAGLTHKIRTAQRMLVSGRQEWRRAVAAGGNRACAATIDRSHARQIRSAELH